MLADPDTNDPANPPFFSEERIAELLASHVTFYGAAAEGWDSKASYYSDRIDVMENGSDRKYSQLYKNAKDRCEGFRKQALEWEMESTKGNRTVGVSFDIGCTEDWGDDGLNPLYAPYPLSRFPVIM